MTWYNNLIILKVGEMTMARKGEFKYTEDEVIQILKKFYKEHGKITSLEYQKSKTKPAIRTIMSMFGSWDNALTKAEIPLNEYGAKYTKEQAIKALIDFYNEHGTTSNYQYRKSNYKPDALTITKLFGSWANAIDEARLTRTVSKVKGNTQYNKQDIIKKLIDFNEKHGFISRDSYNASGEKPSSTTIVRIFGGWAKAMKEAGLEVHVQGQKLTEVDRERKYYEIISTLNRFYAENKLYISHDMYLKSGQRPHPRTIIEFFGSWNKALEAAGLPINQETIYASMDLELKCQECNKVFKPKSRDAKYCSKRCWIRKHERDKVAERKVKGQCAKCGKEKEDKSKYRCSECLIKHREHNKKYKQKIKG
jgi:hypothetical protein